jgi:hypothetical protein
MHARPNVFHRRRIDEPAKALGPRMRSPKEPPDHRAPLPERTRVRMSALGAARCPKFAGREGVVIGSGRYRSTVRIMFDGFKSPTSLHSSYIEPVVEEEGVSRSGRDAMPPDITDRRNRR